LAENRSKNKKTLRPGCLQVTSRSLQRHAGFSKVRRGGEGQRHAVRQRREAKAKEKRHRPKAKITPGQRARVKAIRQAGWLTEQVMMGQRGKVGRQTNRQATASRQTSKQTNKQTSKGDPHLLDGF
jgi:hypothetical protein